MANPKKSWLIIGVSVLICLLIGSSVWAKHVGTIITKKGDEFRDVSFTVNYNYKVVTFLLDEKKKSVSFDKIETVLDENGEDITESILGGHYEAKEEDWKLKDDPSVKSFRTKPWNAAICAAPNFSIPIGTYYDGIDPGIGFGGDVFIGLNEKLDLRLSVSKSGMHTSSEWEPIEFSSLRYYMSIQYHSRVIEMVPSKSIFYLYTGLGAITHKSSIMSYSYSETKFMMNNGAGVILLFSKNFGIDFGYALDMVFIGSGSSDGFNTFQALILDFKIGLVTFF